MDRDPFRGIDNSALLERMRAFAQAPGPGTRESLMHELMHGQARLFVQYEPGSFNEHAAPEEALAGLRLTAIDDQNGKRALVVSTSWATTMMPPGTGPGTPFAGLLMPGSDVLLLCDLHRLDGLIIDLQAVSMTFFFRPSGSDIALMPIAYSAEIVPGGPVSSGAISRGERATRLRDRDR